MQVTIIGNGKMAKGIGVRLVNGGHELFIHSKDELKGRELADQLEKSGSSAKVTVESVGSEIKGVSILAVPYGEVSQLADEYNGFAGKVVVDITNPVDFNTFQLIPEPGKSGAEEIARTIPNARVVKGFNTTLAGTLEAGSVDGQELDVFIAGDDQSAKDEVKSLVKSSGMRPIDVGPLAYSRHLEGFGLIQMQIQDQINTNWMSALKFIG
jgi:hypothetical protein